jgi:hypothetical protein
VHRSTSVDEVRQALQDRWTPEVAGVVSGFFEAGGSAGYFLPVSQNPSEWLGEDGGPGERTGLFAAADIDEVGCVVLPSLPGVIRDDVLRFAECRPQLLFLVGERGSRGLSFDHRNLVRVMQSEGGGRGAAWWAGFFESTDYRPSRSGERGKEARACDSIVSDRKALSGLSGGSDVIETVRIWRLREGLRRSLDWGSRWVVFEPDHPFVRRRLEREVRAFLHELALEGVLAPWGGPDLDVRCEPAVDPGRPEERKVILTVRLRLAKQYETMLTLSPGAGGERTERFDG